MTIKLRKRKYFFVFEIQYILFQKNTNYMHIYMYNICFAA